MWEIHCSRPHCPCPGPARRRSRPIPFCWPFGRKSDRDVIKLQQIQQKNTDREGRGELSCVTVVCLPTHRSCNAKLLTQQFTKFPFAETPAVSVFSGILSKDALDGSQQLQEFGHVGWEQKEASTALTHCSRSERGTIKKEKWKLISNQRDLKAFIILFFIQFRTSAFFVSTVLFLSALSSSFHSSLSFSLFFLLSSSSLLSWHRCTDLLWRHLQTSKP